jgi:ribonuclease HI/transposase InsO family protein
VSSFPLGEIT